MHLLRVQVPDFRGLKNIDITFEKDFVPSIFPLGSQNGGGKSTLLQLIFVLLHCSIDDDKKPFLQNLVQGFKVANEEEKRVLAIIDIWDGQKVVELHFFSYKDSSLKELLALDDKKDFDKSYLFSSNFKQLEVVKNLIDYLKSIQDSETPYEIVKASKDRENLKINCEKDIEYLHSKDMMYICNYSSDRNLNDSRDEVLICHFNNIDRKETKFFFNSLSDKIFLAAPSTQILLFLPLNSRKLLFRNQNNLDHTNYMIINESARSKLPAFFTYDFLAVKLFIELFIDARDSDFREAIKTGSYGNSYQTLINDLNLLLGNKRINFDEDFSGVNFKLDNNGETIELYPEDLSHGELKRLSIYIWLKSRNIQDAIVLMDEVEIAFHPDWQYQIISDLKDWAPSNQYILATHSYALCEALTPAHVKEIEPKLIKQESNITNES